MAIIHANQPGAVHNIEPGSIGDRDISSGDPIDAVTKIKNLDKVKGIKGDTGATGPAVSLAANTFILGTAAAAGIATTAPRADDTIAAFDTTAPTTSALADAATVGTVAFAARRDHRHGRESFATNAIVLGTAAAAGVATTPNRSDDTIAAFDATVPTTSAVGDAAATGSVARAARRDHTHGREAFGTPGSSAVGDTVAAGTATTDARSDHRHGREAFATNAVVLGTAAAAGVATTLIRSDDTIAAFDATAPTTSAVGDAAAVGTVARAARRDHTHGREAFAANALLLGTAAAAGVATTLMRRDDTIAAFDTTVPVTQASGDTAATGTVAFAARRDHKHGMPTMATLAINALVLGTAAAAGVATTAPRTDDTIAAFDATVPTTAASGDAAGTGSVAFAARRDHRHGMPTLLVGTPTVTVFTANGTWTRATGTAFVYVRAVGGGGGGGGAKSDANNSILASGGGGGGYSERWMTAATAGASQTVTIGGAGTAGSSAGGDGGAGGNTTFGTLLTANGGGAGLGATVVAAARIAGGAGGTAATGDVNITGQSGEMGFKINDNTARNLTMGAGGSSVLGRGGQASTTVVAGSHAGNAGVGYGAGGGGADGHVDAAGAAGGVGITGAIIVVEIS